MVDRVEWLSPISTQEMSRSSHPPQAAWMRRGRATMESTFIMPLIREQEGFKRVGKVGEGGERG